MVEHSGIGIDEINLFLTIIIRNKHYIFSIQLQQNLIVRMKIRRYEVI